MSCVYHSVDEQGNQNSNTVSVSKDGDRVADIRPIGRIQTVQVEVEPDVTGDVSSDGENPEPTNDDENGENSNKEDPLPPSQSPSSHPLSTESSPESQQSQLSSQQTASALSTPTSKQSISKQDQVSPLPTVAEGLEEAARKVSTKKKSGKPKPLSEKDLMPLHQDIGKSNKQLLEPSTPEFKPTAEWVGANDLTCS